MSCILNFDYKVMQLNPFCCILAEMTNMWELTHLADIKLPHDQLSHMKDKLTDLLWVDELQELSSCPVKN